MGKQAKECQKFFSACLQTRIGPEKFRVLFTTLHDRHGSLHSKDVIEALIKQTQLNSVHDPRVSQYLCETLRMRVVSVADVLSGLLPLLPDGSINGQAAFHDQTMLEIAGVSKPTFQALIFQMLIVEISEGLLNSREDVRAVLQGLIPWMLLFPGSTTMGCLVAAVLSTTIAQEVLTKASANGNQARKTDELR